MTDRELLEKAARAADMWVDHFCLDEDDYPIFHEKNGFYLAWGADWWNPLTDDGDALRLALKCGINIDLDDQSAWLRRDGLFVQEYWGGDYPPCYRHAIVRAAAEIGKAMP